MSDSLPPHGLQPIRLLCPWNFPGENIGLGCHFLLQRIFLTQNRTGVSCIAGEFLTRWATREAEWNKLEKDKSHMISFIKWNLKKSHTNELVCNRNRVKDVENQFMVIKEERGRGINWQIGIDIYTLLYIKQTTNKNLLHSTRKSTQYSIVIYMGK